MLQLVSSDPDANVGFDFPDSGRREARTLRRALAKDLQPATWEAPSFDRRQEIEEIITGRLAE